MQVFPFALALVVLVVSPAAAFPTFFAGGAPTCTSHPETRFGPHPAPSVNATETLTFVVRSAADNSTTATVCPGLTYNVLVTLADLTGHFILTSSTAGSKVVAADGSNGCSFTSTDCPNRYCVAPSESTNTKALRVTLPCSATDTEAVLKVTMSTGMGGQYKWNSVSLPFATSGCPDIKTLDCSATSTLKMTVTPAALNLYIAPTNPPKKKRASVAVALEGLPPAGAAPVLKVTLPAALKNLITCTPGAVDIETGSTTVVCQVKSGAKVSKLTAGTVTLRVQGLSAKATFKVNVRP